MPKPYQDHCEDCAIELPPAERPGFWKIAVAFNKVSMVSFGGGLTAFARNILVEQKKWLTDEEFLQALSVCQILPGPNTINLSVFIGCRLRGLVGSLAAITGLISIPFIIVVTLTILYFQNHSIPAVESTLKGLAAAAAGLAFGLGLKLGSKYVKDPLFLGFGMVSFLAVGVLRISMIPVIILLAPLAVYAYIHREKHEAKQRAAASTEHPPS